jgi:hypothetical protein
VILGLCVGVGLYFLGPGAVGWSAEVNAVGYINLSLPEGYHLIANQLSNRENRVDQILPSVAEGTQLVTFDGRDWITNEFVAGSWTYPDIPLPPGEAALLRSPTNSIQTWVGSVLQGELKVLIPAGGSLRSSLVPQAGKLSEVLQFPKVVGTKIYKVDPSTGQRVLRATCTDAGWEPEEPVLNVAEGFYVEAPREYVWSRAFAFNPGDSPTSTAIRVVTQPRSWQVKPGDIVSLSVEATSTNRLYYRWQRNGNDIPDANDPTLALPITGTESVGRYWVKIWDEKSWVWSEVARVELAGAELTRLIITQDSQRRGVLLTPQATAGRAPTIEVSTDLVRWTELGDAPHSDADSVLDPFSSQQAARFYRLRLD